MVENFNLAAAKARGDYIKILPHDDVLPTDSIARLMSALRPGDALVVGLREFIYEGATRWQRWFYDNQNRFWRVDRRFGSGEVSPRRYLQVAARNCTHNSIGEPGCALVSASAFAAVGGFTPSFHQLCDLRLWHALGSDFGLRVVPQVVARFRVHGDSESSRRQAAISEPLLLENWQLSVLIVSKLVLLTETTALRTARLNLILDSARLRRAGIPQPDSSAHTFRVPAGISALARFLAALPVKRVYQLLALKAGCALLGVVGVRIRELAVQS